MLIDGNDQMPHSIFEADGNTFYVIDGKIITGLIALEKETYFEQSDKLDDRLGLQVHLHATVELLSDVLHVLAVARLPKHPLGGRASLPQQHQELLAGEGRQRGKVIIVHVKTHCARVCVCGHFGMSLTKA